MSFLVVVPVELVPDAEAIPALTPLMENGELSTGEPFNLAWGSDAKIYLAIPDGIMAVDAYDLIPQIMRGLGAGEDLWSTFERDETLDDIDGEGGMGYVNSIYEAWFYVDQLGRPKRLRFRRRDGAPDFSGADLARIRDEFASDDQMGHVVDIPAPGDHCVTMRFVTTPHPLRGGP